MMRRVSPVASARLPFGAPQRWICACFERVEALNPRPRLRRGLRCFLDRVPAHVGYGREVCRDGREIQAGVVLSGRAARGRRVRGRVVSGGWCHVVVPRGRDRDLACRIHSHPTGR